MYVYQDLGFRVTEKRDLNALKEIHNDQDVWENLFNIDFVDDNSQDAWWNSLHRKRDDLRYVICLKDNPEQVVGRLRIQSINQQHNNCEVGLDLHRDYRGKGFGSKSYEMLLKFLFEEYNMNMVYLKVADFNPRAKEVYKKVGFKETGRYPKFFFRKNKYWDYIIMSITREEYLA